MHGPLIDQRMNMTQYYGHCSGPLEGSGTQKNMESTSDQTVELRADHCMYVLVNLFRALDTSSAVWRNALAESVFVISSQLYTGEGMVPV